MITAFLIKYWELIIIGFLLADIIVQKTPWKGDDDILAMIKNFIRYIFTTKPGQIPMILFGISLVSFLLVGQVLASPFLVCDPQTNVTHYVISGDINVTVPALDLGDGTWRLNLDLAGLSGGMYNIEIKAKNIWGESVAVPFVFTKAVAGVPGNIRIE